MGVLLPVLLFHGPEILMLTVGRVLKRHAPYKVERVLLPLLHLSPIGFSLVGLFLGNLWIPRWPFWVLLAFGFLLVVGIINFARILSGHTPVEMSFGPRVMRWAWKAASALVWLGAFYRGYTLWL